MATENVWWKEAENSKPSYDETKLKGLKQKAEKLRKWKKTVVPKRPKLETIPKDEPPARVLKLSSKISSWREEFSKFRSNQRSKLSLYNAKCRGHIGLVVQIYAITGRWTYQLKNYKPIRVPPGRRQQYTVFDKLWMTYDKSGSGKMTYKEFEKLKTDVGFQWNDCPSAREIDPAGTGYVIWEDACRWWFSKEHMPAYSRPLKRSFSEVMDKKEKDNSQIMNRYYKRQKRSKEFRMKRLEGRKKLGKRKRKMLLEVSVAGPGKKKQKLEYDVTDYKPLEIDNARLTQVDVVWKKYDKDGSGRISQADFQKLAADMSKGADAKAFDGQATVVFEDFANWWFGLQPKKQAEEKEKASGKKKETKLLSNVEVKKIRQKFAEKFALRSQKVKDAVKNSPMPKGKSRRTTNVEIFAGAKKITYDITNYQKPFVRRQFEAQERHLELIWKDFEKEGTGKLDKEQFGKFVESFGSKVEDEKLLASLQDKDGFITWEKFDEWWFSSDQKALVPMPPPAPKEKHQKASDIRKSVKATAEKLKEKYNLKSEAEIQKRAEQYSARKADERKKFRAERIARSPKKRQKKDELNIDIFSKKAGNIQHLSFVA